jgi:hypothetical protein
MSSFVDGVGACRQEMPAVYAGSGKKNLPGDGTLKMSYGSGVRFVIWVYLWVKIQLSLPQNDVSILLCRFFNCQACTISINGKPTVYEKV